MFYLQCDDCNGEFTDLREAYEHEHDRVISARFFVLSTVTFADEES